MPNPKENVIEDFPDDFFNDLADESFIEEVVERDDEDDPHLNRCIEEIKQLERKIEKKKQVIKERQDGLTNEPIDGRSRTRSRSRDRELRRHRERDRRRRSKSRSRSPRTRSPHSSRHGRYDERTRDRDRRYVSPLRNRPGRRSRSKSPHRSKRSSSTHKNISFLEELAQKFAEKGQAFPERDALINQINNNAGIDGPPMPMNFGNVVPFDQQQMVQPQLISIPNFQPQGFVPQPVPVQPNLIPYGINPMNILAGNPIPPVAGNLPPFGNVDMQPEIPAFRGNAQNLPAQLPMAEPGLSDNQKASIINRCEHAIKLIRGKDNKVPILKFLYNRTSLVEKSKANEQSINQINKSPLHTHSIMNVPFKLNAPGNMPVKGVNGLKLLPKRVRDVAQSLGINGAFLFDKLRTKEINAQITDKIKSGLDSEASSSGGEILIQTNTVPVPTIQTSESSTQTNELKCERCTERNKRIMVSAHTQVFLKNCSIGVQTNEKDYREPIVELLSKMSAAQLVAIKDFANIIDEPRACSELEYSRIRERLIDIYNLSQRDADTVRAAEENQMDEMPYMDRRFRGGDDFSEGPPRDFNRRSNSPRFNGNFMGDRNNFGGDNFEPNDRGMINERMGGPRGMLDERLGQRMDDSYQRQLRLEAEERDREIYLEEERRRQLELELIQRRYDEQQMEREQLERERSIRMEQERRMNMGNFQQQNQLQFEDEMRQFNRDKEERDLRSQNMFNSSRGSSTMNRRGRGAFRENFRGGRGSRR